MGLRAREWSGASAVIALAFPLAIAILTATHWDAASEQYDDVHVESHTLLDDGTVSVTFNTGDRRVFRPCITRDRVECWDRGAMKVRHDGSEYHLWH